MNSTLIIGGGVMGLATAYQLARQNVRVTLLERLTPGSGASLASLGALWPSRPSILGPAQNFQRQSLWLLEPFLLELHSISQTPIHFRRGGHLEILTSPQAAADAQRDAALPTNWPTFGHPAPLTYLPPNAPLPAPITPDSFGVLHSHVTAQIDLPSYIAALTAACTRLGVTIHSHTPVTSLEFSDASKSTVTAARTVAGDFTADTILITAGAWTPLLDPLLAQAAPIRPVKGQAIEVEVPPPPKPMDSSPWAYAPDQALDSSSTIPQLIMRRDKTYIVPWGKTALIGSTTEKNVGFDETPNPDSAEKLLASAQSFCPALAGAKILRTWAGLRPDAPKHRPIMGLIPTTTNLYVAAGHYKTGIALSPLVAQCLSALILHQTPPADLAPFAPTVRKGAP